jgi:hypothetical protein
MTQTGLAPDLDERTKEELQPPCEITVQYVTLYQTFQIEKCERGAEWAGLLPCCGKPVLVCTPHQKDSITFRCIPCNQLHPDLINWSRL